LLARAGSPGQSAVEVDGGAVEEVVGLFGPDALTRDIDGVDQRLDIGALEAATEVAGRGRIGNAAGAQRIEEVRAVAAQLDVLQTGAIAQGVVGEVEHMIGFVIGQGQLEQMQMLIDRFDQTRAPHQQMHGPNAAATDAADLVGHFVMNVAGRQLRLEPEREILLVEPAFDSTLATGVPATEDDLHLKSFLDCDD
jgi:hypothetical protein